MEQGIVIGLVGTYMLAMTILVPVLLIRMFRRVPPGSFLAITPASTEEGGNASLRFVLSGNAKVLPVFQRAWQYPLVFSPVSRDRLPVERNGRCLAECSLKMSFAPNPQDDSLSRFVTTLGAFEAKEVEDIVQIILENESRLFLGLQIEEDLFAETEKVTLRLQDHLQTCLDPLGLLVEHLECTPARSTHKISRDSEFSLDRRLNLD